MGKVVWCGRGSNARYGVLALLLWLAGLFPACAAPDQASCQLHPQSEWMPENELIQMLEEYGYVIRELKITNNCYEMTGDTPEGDRVLLWLDTLTADVVRSDTVEQVSP